MPDKYTLDEVDVIKSIMSEEIVVAAPDITVEQLAILMRHAKVTCLPIISNQGKLVGIVSEGDIIRRIRGIIEPEKPSVLGISYYAKMMEEEAQVKGKTASEIMTKRVVSVSEDTPIKQAAQLLLEKKIKNLPVLRNEKIVGIVGRKDFIHYYIKKWRFTGEDE